MKSINFNLSSFLLVFLIPFFFFTGMSYHKGISLLFLPEISWIITLWAFVLTTLTGLLINNLRKLLRPGQRDFAVFATKLLAFWMIFAGGGHHAQAQSCNCKEYIYLNEPFIGAVLKFEVGTGTALTEVTGANGAGHWYPGTGVSQLPSPHGLATDLNGNLYIASTFDFGAQIRKFNCDGVIEPVSATTIQDFGGNMFNMFSIGNLVYKSGTNSIRVFDLCTGQFVGSKTLGGAGGALDWGLHYNAQTQQVYATERNTVAGSGAVWRMSVTELNDFSTSASPFINYGSTTTINPGDNYVPLQSDLNGITSDNNGNMYVVATQNNSVLKYNSAGQFISSVTGASLNAPNGIVWSETTNRLYISNYTDDPASDCISVIDANNSMTFLGTGAPNPNLPANNTAKAIAIIKECCPGSLPPTFTKNVCGAVGSKFYLNQEAFSTCDGIVCGSSWVPQGAPAGMTFDPCDNSVTLTGTGCTTFSLNLGAVTSTGCGAQSSTFSICSSVAPVLSNPSGPQSICEGGSGSNITVNSSSNAVNSIRFVRFTTDQMAFATPTVSEAANIYAGIPVATVTPTGGAAPYTATLTTAAAGWSSAAPGTYYIYAIANPDLGASCRPVQEIVVTIVDKPEVAVSSGAICAGGFIDLNTLVTSNSPAGALSFHTTLANANTATNPLVNTVVLPSATTTYYVRSAANATCYSVGTLPVTVSEPPILTVSNGQICPGNSLNLATLVTNSGGGTLSYFTTLTNAQNNINALASPVVAPTSATNYFIRSISAAGCYTIKNVVVSLAAANCGAIQVSGPN